MNCKELMKQNFDNDNSISYTESECFKTPVFQGSQSNKEPLEYRYHERS